MNQYNNSENRISYSDFLKYMDSGEWNLSFGINDRMTVGNHLMYIEHITKFEDSQIEFVIDDFIPELASRIDVFIRPTVRETEISSNKYIKFTKVRKGG